MELKFINYEYKNKLISMSLEAGKIYGFTGKTSRDIIPIITLKVFNKGQIIINEEKVTKDTLMDYRKKITLITTLNSIQSNIRNIMIEYIKRNNLNIKNPAKKIKDSLRIVELDETILDKYTYEISSSEKKMLAFAVGLLGNPDIIVLDEPFKGLDKHNEKKLMMILQRLKEQFKKTIIIISEDSNILYKYTNEMFFLKNNEILLAGKTNELYLRVDYLKKNKFSIPEIVEFTYIAKKKKEVKIDYHKDVRDIIKDIYKHI